MKNLIKGIIDKSIKKFIYIDDRVCLPYEQNNQYSSSSEEMFNSFLKENKHLRIFRYDPSVTTEEYRSMFDNNDILILDWHLNGEDLDDNVFNIVSEAVKHKIIKYIFIYTGYEDAAFIDLLAGFDPSSKLEKFNEYLEKFNKFLDELDISVDEDDLLDTRELIEASFDIVKDQKEINKYIEAFVKKYDLDINKFKKSMGINKYNISELIDMLRYQYYKVNSEISFKSLNVNLKHIGNKNNLVLDNTHIMVIPKDVEPQMLLERMYDSLSSEPHGFFNFLNHEILYKFHDHFFYHAKGVSNIHDAIVKNKYDNEEIEDFIETIYSDVFRSVLRNNEISLLQNTENYFLDKDLSTYSHNEDYLKNMNYFISNNLDKQHLDSISREKTSFGDIFKIELIDNKNIFDIDIIEQFNENSFKLKRPSYKIDSSKFEYKYAICITQHCDSLRPKKIDHNYSFVFSKNNISFDKNMDEKFCSFINENDKINIIDWADNKIVKPRSLFIVEKHNIRNTIIAKYGDYYLKLTFIAQQKDIFTQRLSNEAFRYPMRVGVSYLNKLSSSSCSC